jgi:hypothetical protein
MADTSRLVQIETVTQKALYYAREEDNQYKRFLQFVMDGWKELRKGVVKDRVEIKKVTPNSINRIPFEQDMEEFIGIGIPMGGKIWLLTERDDIIATFTEEDETISLDASDGEGVTLPTAQYENLLSTGGVNIHGYYKVDWNHDVVIVNATTRSELLMVYRTSGIHVDSITYVPSNSENALIAYADWKNAESKVKSTSDIPIAQYKEQQWAKQMMRLKKREMFTTQEFWDNWAKSATMLRR